MNGSHHNVMRRTRICSCSPCFRLIQLLVSVFRPATHLVFISPFTLVSFSKRNSQLCFQAKKALKKTSYATCPAPTGRPMKVVNISHLDSQRGRYFIPRLVETKTELKAACMLDFIQRNIYLNNVYSLFRCPQVAKT